MFSEYHGASKTLIWLELCLSSQLALKQHFLLSNIGLFTFRSWLTQKSDCSFLTIQCTCKSQQDLILKNVFELWTMLWLRVLVAVFSRASLLAKTLSSLANHKGGWF